MQARLATILSLAALALTALAVVPAVESVFGLDDREAVASFGIEGEGDIPLPVTELATTRG